MASTIVSWGMTICLVGAAIYVYKPELFRSPPSEAKPIPAETSSKPLKKAKPKKSPVTKLAGDEAAESGSGSQGSKKRKIVSVPIDKSTSTNLSEGKQQQASKDDKDELSDKDFAKQLAQAQSGTKLQVPQKQQQQQQQQQTSKKERKASKLATAASPDQAGVSEASSTTGRDADDDLTPGESPDNASVDSPVLKGGDVSDMLEAPAPKATTLRLTDVSNESKTKKPANKAFEPVLSKKKRNEKQRKEEQRLAREESDRVHEAKKQEQLRKARLAAGTSNQTKANNFAAKSNAWQSGAPSEVKTAPSTEAQPFLDTFDPSASTAAPAQGAVHTETSVADSANDLKATVGENTAAALTASSHREGMSASKRQEAAGELWEEDQIKLLKEQEQEDAWESVTNKKSKRKGKQDNDSASGASSPTRPVPASVAPKVNGGKVDSTSKKAPTVNRFDTFQDKKIDGGLQDAEWEA